jgi:hypothetical protein
MNLHIIGRKVNCQFIHQSGLKRNLIMISKTKLTGAVLAMGAASVFALAPVVTASAATSSHHKDVHCYGVNTCKGKAVCGPVANSCKGKNECKGKGYVKMSKEACDNVGGRTTVE